MAPPAPMRKATSISNPHGYGTENGAYDPALVLEVAR